MKIAFTIATANYLAQAKTVADSFLVHNQEYQYFIVLLDAIDTIDQLYFGKIRIIDITELNMVFLDEMVARYTIFELSNAVKPYCADYFFNYQDADIVVYFDSDIYVYNKLSEIDNQLISYDIVITPHMLQPPPYDGLKIKESEVLNAGIFNGGFFALKKTEESFRFLNWWKVRMRTESLVDVANGLFVDQLWLNFVPLYFKKVKVLDNLGYNVAFWNLHERKLSTSPGDTILVNNEVPLVFFHFSGYDFKYPQLISKHQNRHSFENRTDVLPLFTNYADAVMKNGHEDFSKMDCYYASKKDAVNLAGKSVSDHKNIVSTNSQLKSVVREILVNCKLALKLLTGAIK